MAAGRNGESFPGSDTAHLFLYRISPERFEPVDRAPALDRVDDLGRIIAGEDEPAGLGIALHGPAERGLGIGSEGIRFIQEEDLECGIPERGSPGELLDLVAHDIDAPFVRGIHLPEVPLPVILKKFLGKGHRRGGLADTCTAGEEEVGEVTAPDIGRQGAPLSRPARRYPPVSAAGISLSRSCGFHPCIILCSVPALSHDPVG